MTLVAIGPIELIRDGLGLSRYDEHVKAWRAHRWSLRAAYSLHVTDYNLWRATHASRN